MSKLVTNENLQAYHAELAEHIKLLQRGTAYSLNDIVNYDGKTLKCTTAGTTATTKPDVSALDVGDTLPDGTAVWTRVDLDKRGLDYWASSTIYALDDVVIYNDKIYRCTTAHTSSSTFDDTKFTEISASISGGGSIDEWTSGTSYSSGNLVINNNVLYKANTTTSTTWVDSEWDIIGTTFNTTSTYAQKIVTNVVAPYEMLLQVGDSNYCKPPIDVLKKTGGSDNVTLTLENYNNSSVYTGTSDFLKIANSKAKLYNYKEYPITTQTLSTIDIGVSDEIDFDDFVSSGSGGIDDNTLVLLHFNDDINDACGNVWADNGSMEYTNGKFDKGILRESVLSCGYIQSPSSDISNFMLGNYTIDWWWKFPITGGIHTGDGAPLIGGGNGNWEFSAIGSNISILVHGVAVYVNLSFGSVSTYQDGNFHHFAVTHENNTYKLFVDGELKSTVTDTTSYSAISTLYLFSFPGFSNYLLGVFDEFRISNIARWTSDFTPPTDPYARPSYNISSLEVN